MGHYYAEMFHNGEDKTFTQRHSEYQQTCAREISNIIGNNPIRFEDVQI